MLVNFQRSWFAAGHLFRVSINPQEVPDELLNQLPKTAEVLEEEEVVVRPKKVKTKDTPVALSELAKADKTV